ncbi:MAG TPA: response regulator transcription factor [candidate division Zixibacteria bacterium]|nr:response regulator transcription factor [candidate division Zixibacteria bacterium]
MAHRVLLADDHLVVREGLKNLLVQEGFEIAAEVSDGRQAIEAAHRLHPDVALIDISMPLLNGIDAARQIRTVSPQTKTILLTMYKEEQYVMEALRSGVKGYVLKTQAASELVEAIRAALNGKMYLSPSISESVVRAALAAGPAVTDPLTQREREVLQLIAEGKTNKEISRQLGMSVKTVETHRHNLMVKLDIHDTAGLVRHAIKIGLIQP